MTIVIFAVQCFLIFVSPFSNPYNYLGRGFFMIAFSNEKGLRLQCCSKSSIFASFHHARGRNTALHRHPLGMFFDGRIPHSIPHEPLSDYLLTKNPTIRFLLRVRSLCIAVLLSPLHLDRRKFP